jgi:hypothetical protein
LLFLRFGVPKASAIGSITSERLHAHHRAKARIDALDLARDQAIGRRNSGPDAAIFRPAACGPRSPSAPISRKIADVGLFLPKGVEHARREPLFGIAAGGGLNHPFLVAQLLGEKQRIIPPEFVLRHFSSPSDAVRV